MQENKQETETILNSQVRDSGGKIIFGDNTLCSQFLRDYIPLPYLKDVQPEDIEDVSDRFVPLFAEERNADRVKKVNIRGAEAEGNFQAGRLQVSGYSAHRVLRGRGKLDST